LSGLLDSLLEWARLHLVPPGIPGLILTAFTEPSFFPIPPDAILIPLALLDPGNAALYGLELAGEKSVKKPKSSSTSTALGLLG
jgi:membrane protein YqaA with SNARE-associated domain